MKYVHAKKLHNEDEVIRKSDECPLFVISTAEDKGHKQIFVTCDDGNTYHHTELR